MKDMPLLTYLAHSCPNLMKKLQGKITKGAVLHTEITQILGKQDRNVTCEDLERWEAATKVVKKTVSPGKKVLGLKDKQLELDLSA